MIAQSSETAKFDGMPNSAIDTGVVDYHLARGNPGRALSYVRHPIARRSPTSRRPTASVPEGSIDVILRLLRKDYDIDFSHYKPRHRHSARASGGCR